MSRYTQIFTRELPDSLYALERDPGPANQIRASVTYNHVVEGCLALTGYYGWGKVCSSRGILPGMQKIIKHIGDDERRHMAWGTFTCRRHVAADDAMWQVVTDRMAELMPLALATVNAGTARVGRQSPVRHRPRGTGRLRRRQTHPPARRHRVAPAAPTSA